MRQEWPPLINHGGEEEKGEVGAIVAELIGRNLKGSAVGLCVISLIKLACLVDWVDCGLAIA